MTHIDRATELIHTVTLPLGVSVARHRDKCLHAARQLDAAGLLMPDLPSDNIPPFGSGEWSAGFEFTPKDAIVKVPLDAHTYAWAPGEVGLVAPHLMTTDQAEAVALALLAAVKSDREYTDRHARQENQG